ncbi:copine-3-like isoform X2 [Apostichopus japonicus]|uniref:copine-3-like isoform X2 n=1 Tax=Stichopus japonicus TaxID=307972 RepID=UPI003AB4D803
MAFIPQGNSDGASSPRIPGVNRLLTKVEMRLSCKNLMDKDIASKSDPLVVVMIYDQMTKKWTEVDRTERIKNNQNPTFTKGVIMEYHFEEVQKVKFSVYDIDNNTKDLRDDDFLGETECTVGQLVSAKKITKPLVLKDGKPAKKGTITIDTEEVAENHDVLVLSFRASSLDKKDVMGKSDPFLEFYKQGTTSEDWHKVHQTEVIKNTLNPVWKPAEVGVRKLCNGDYDKKLKMQVFDYDFDGGHDLIGEFYTTARELIFNSRSQIMCFDHDEGSANDLIGEFYTSARQLMESGTRQIEWDCINPKKKAKKKNYKNSGKVFLTSCEVKRHYTFLDFILGGCQINFTVGIDFTGSNGDPQEATSLHFISDSAPNEYTQAIVGVGEVIQDYDSDKLFPALGFGAKIPPNNEISHEFAINFNANNPFCSGVAGVVAAYQACLRQVTLWGPTNVAPIISHVAKFASEALNQNKASQYFILLLLTDGVLTDMYETRDAIVRASHLPMSIIIVGVGTADFTDMRMLDGDDGKLRSPNGEAAARDIVQFVPFRDFKGTSPYHLTKAVLAEIPQQVEAFFNGKNLLPPKFQPAAAS